MEELKKVIDKIEQLNDKIEQLKEKRDNLLDKDEQSYTKREIMFMKEYEAQLADFKLQLSDLNEDKERWFNKLVEEEKRDEIRNNTLATSLVAPNSIVNGLGTSKRNAPFIVFPDSESI
jgi:DNA repair exonuclease SbcCD ATPase subunit